MHQCKRTLTLSKTFKRALSSKFDYALLDRYDEITKRGENREKIVYQTGDVVHGFILKNVQLIPELSITTYQFQHEKTKADYIHVDCADRDNCFSVAFRTPCVNNTGVSHVLEHTTLCGSERFPVHDPFMKMRKRSLQTFMNALTADDHTTYPVSSTIPRDLANLMDVYCDSVFFPLLRLADFKQEGWRYEDGVIKGVVYNEMKGKLPEQIRAIYEGIGQCFLKGTNYAYNSGGIPSAIPYLKYEDLLQWHSYHYHPSNCLFYTYGDIHPSYHLHYLNDNVLSRFEYNETSHRIHVQAKNTEENHSAAKHVLDCPPDSYTPLSTNRHYIEIYPTGLTTQPEDSMKLQVLCMLLFRGQASPFYKSMINGGYGQLFNPLQGYNAYSKNNFIGIGLSGVSESISDETIHNVIRKTLEEVKRNGFEEGRINGVMNEMEMMFKQIKTGFGLMVMQSIGDVWTHGGDVSKSLLMDKQLKQMKQIGVNCVMKEMVEKYLLEKNQPTCITFIPNQHYLDNCKKDEEATLQFIKMLYSKNEMQYDERINKNIYTKEVVDDVLPTLSIHSIPKRHHILSPKSYPSSFPLHCVTTSTNNIIYPRLLFNLHSLTSSKDVYNLPILLYLLNYVGTKEYSAEELEIQIGECCGGINMGVSAYDQYHGDGSSYRNVVVIGSSLLMQNENLSKLSSILQNKMQRTDFEKSLSICKILLESYIADKNMSFDSGIPLYNVRRNLSCSSIVGYLSDCYSGYRHYTYVSSLKDIVSDEQKLLRYLKEEIQPLMKRVFSPKNMEVFITSDEKNLKESLQWANEARSLVVEEDGIVPNPFLGNKRSNGFLYCSPDELQSILKNEESACNKNRFTVASIDTNFVCASLPSISTDHKNYDGIHILTQMMSTNYLLHYIREEEGAYGTGNFHANRLNVFTSYNDPNVLKSVEIFKKCCSLLREGSFTEKDINEAKLGVFADIDAPMEPQQIGFSDTITGKTSEDRQKQRDVLLGINKEELLELAREAYGFETKTFRVTVFGNKHKGEEVKGMEDWIVENQFSVCSNKANLLTVALFVEQWQQYKV